MASSIVEVRPRAAGANLSVDVLVDGFSSNMLVPYNWSGKSRVDGLTLDGTSFAITVRAGTTYIGHGDIRRLS